MTFGLSTHLFHGDRLTRQHLERIKAHDFDRVEVFATQTHIDYRNPDDLKRLGDWLDQLGLRASSVHAPICDGLRDGVWGRAYSTASANTVLRDEAVSETLAAVAMARDIGARVCVVHLGLPHGQPIPADDNSAAAVRNSLETIAEGCATAGVQLALEVIPNALATASAVLEWLQGELDLGSAAACLDVGHAHLTGGAPEAVEHLGGYIATTHLHDNRGRDDEHLVPFDGTIDWAATLAALVKVGYTGPLIFELPDHGDADEVLRKAVRARTRIQSILDDLTTPFPFKDNA